MISSLHLKKFRKHVDLEINLTPGLNVIRGCNEVGKTTLIESVLYACYGAKVLRTTLAKTVTWGSKESELSVKAALIISGVTYTFTRSKSGAECNWDGGKVTGQAEVTAFAGNLLGADAKVAHLLMLSSQSGLRGALDDGPTAVSALIGKLADFDIIDGLLDAATQKLRLGVTQPLITKLAEADTQVYDAKMVLAQDDNSEELKASVHALELRYQAAEKHSVDVLQPVLSAADAAVEAAKDAIEARKRAETAVSDLQSRILIEQTKLHAAEREASAVIDTAAIEALRRQLLDAQGHAALVLKYETWQKLPPFPEVHWEGTKASFDIEVADNDKLVTTIQNDEAQCNQTAVSLKRQLITSGKCPTCGHAALGDDHVKAHNDGIQKQIAQAQSEAAAAAARLVEPSNNKLTFARLTRSAKVFEDAALTLGDLVNVDRNLYPPKVTWKGAAPRNDQSVSIVRRELAELEAKQTAVAQAQGRAAAHTSTLANLRVLLAGAEADVAAIVAPDLAPLNAAYDAAYKAFSDNVTSSYEIKVQCDAQAQTLAGLVAQRQQATAALEYAERRVAELKAELAELELNNAVVAKLKRLKPMITDDLWNTVLAAVSNFFSQLRGEQSVVSKDAEGFKVNGEVIEGLSGSTLDVLALGIRVALTKTFIPHASFLALDEPSAGCDNVRTASVLGFLASSGFQQVLLASHDDLCESVADNVLNLSQN